MIKYTEFEYESGFVLKQLLKEQQHALVQEVIKHTMNKLKDEYGKKAHNEKNKEMVGSINSNGEERTTQARKI